MRREQQARGLRMGLLTLPTFPGKQKAAVPARKQLRLAQHLGAGPLVKFINALPRADIDRIADGLPHALPRPRPPPPVYNAVFFQQAQHIPDRIFPVRV